MPHQQEVYDFLKDKKTGAMFLDPGLGKTFVAIKLMQNLDYKKIVIFGPSAVQKNWENEIERFWPTCKLPIHVSYGGDSKRKKKLEEFVKTDQGILIVNYEIMTSSLKELVHEFRAEQTILDESHLVKSHKSKRSKEILKLRKDADSCFLLTGTPVLQTVTDLFMQFYIMDLGKTFGTNFYVFQRKYMIDKNAMWAGSHNYFPNWQVNEKMMPELENKIKESAIYMEKEKVLDLPPLIKKNYYVSLNPEQKRIYKDLSKKLIAEITEDKDLSVENALTKVLRLNQICAGHLSEDNIILKSFKDCEKNKLVLEIVDKVVESGEKIILWTVFKQDVVVLTELLSKYRNNLCYITGLQNTKQKAVNMSMFENDMEIKICIANMTAGGTGINLIAAKHSILFSRNYKLGDHLQSEARNHRKGSERHSTIIQHNLIVKDSVEEEIVKALEGKKKIGKDLFSNPEKFNQFDKDFKSSLLKGFISGLY